MAIEDDEVATKRDLAGVEARLVEVESRLVERIDDVEARLTRKMDSLGTSFLASMDEKLESMETRLLTAFEKWVVPIKWPRTQA